MITLTGIKKSELNVHQTAVDCFEVSVTDEDKGMAVCYLSEKQIKTLAETLNNYLDI